MFRADDGGRLRRSAVFGTEHERFDDAVDTIGQSDEKRVVMADAPQTTHLARLADGGIERLAQCYADFDGQCIGQKQPAQGDRKQSFFHGAGGL